MADVNNCTFGGRLTRDAEQKFTAKGTSVVSFDIACNTGFGEYAKVTYITINFWAKSGPKLLPYLLKGKSVTVWGEIELQKWVSKHDGSNNSKLVLNSNNIVLASGGNNIRQDEGEAYPVGDDGETPVVF